MLIRQETEDLERFGRSLKVRVISGICFTLFMMGIVWLGGPVLAVCLCVISIMGYLELTKATGVRHTHDTPKEGEANEATKQKKDQITGFEIVTSIFIVLYFLLIYLFQNATYYLVLFALLLVGHMLIYVFRFPKYEAHQVMFSYFSFLYGPVMLSFILMTRLLSNQLDTEAYNIGFFAVWMILISAWGSDTCAYFAGVALGKHKIAPILSPKKTVEGCIGGILGSSFFGYLYGNILVNNGIIPTENIWIFVALGLFGSVAGQIGDLAASAIKRNYKIKDYGKCIPGHGGVMDRFDSVIFTSPLIYTLVVIFILR